MLSHDLKNLSNYLLTIRLIAQEKGLPVKFSAEALEQLNNSLDLMATDAVALEAVTVPGHQRNPEYSDNVVRLIPIQQRKEPTHDLVS